MSSLLASPPGRASSTSTVATTSSVDTRPPFPLTTIFTPSPSCFSLTSSTTLQLATDTGCSPLASFGPPPRLYYSPGVCPASYTSAHNANNGELVQPIGKDETAIFCCPSNFAYSANTNSGSISRWCGQFLTTAVKVTSVNSKGSSTVISLSSPRTSITYGVVQIRYHASDLSSLETQPTASSSSSSSNSSPTSSPSSDSSGLSSGAKAGIGIGVALVVLAVLGGLLFFVLRRRKAKKTSPMNGTHDNVAGTHAAEVDATPVDHKDKRSFSEADSMPVSELPHTQAPVELPADGVKEVEKK